MWPTISTPCASRSKRCDGRDAEQHGDRATRARPARTRAARARARARARPTSSVSPLVSPRLPSRSPQLLEEVALALGHAEQLRHLADDDRQREADDEALQHRLGDEAREEAEPQRARRPARRIPTTSAERDRELEERVRAARGEVADGRGRQRRGRRHRPGDEVPRAAERGVEDQRAGRGVEADHRRDAGDRGVGERLGHEHRPHGQPGDQVAAQPRAVVALRERGEDRQPHGAATS